MYKGEGVKNLSKLQKVHKVKRSNRIRINPRPCFPEGKAHLHLSTKQFMNCIYRITTLVLSKVGAGVSVIGCKLSLGSVKKLPNLYSEKGLRALSSVG